MEDRSLEDPEGKWSGEYKCTKWPWGDPFLSWSVKYSQICILSPALAWAPLLPPTSLASTSARSTEPSEPQFLVLHIFPQTNFSTSVSQWNAEFSSEDTASKNHGTGKQHFPVSMLFPEHQTWARHLLSLTPPTPNWPLNLTSSACYIQLMPIHVSSPLSPCNARHHHLSLIKWPSNWSPTTFLHIYHSSFMQYMQWPL